MKETSKIVHRKIPMIVRILLYLYIAILLVVIGLMIGYGILGNPFEVFRIETWQYIKDLMRG